MYHRITEAGPDPFGICVHPDRFLEHLESLQDHADIVPLSSIRERSSDVRVAITFDDGYADNATTARAVLESVAAHATFFIVTGALGTRREFWWDRLEQLVANLPQEIAGLDVSVSERVTVRLQSGSSSDRKRTLQTLHAALMPQSRAEIEVFLDLLAAEAGVSLADRATHRPMDLEELIDLSLSPIAEIGAHSISHPALASLHPDEQRKEIAGSRHHLEHQLNTPIRAFAYPFGEHGGATPELVKDSGLELACTVEPGKVVPETDPFLIPRYEVHDWSRQEFTEWLRYWLGR
jgi:peptidoglycan/xylan/chitin deacetylase (PgdA/CDA1 family)